MNIVGNVNGSYQAPKIDLFELAKKQGNEQNTLKAVSSVQDENAEIKVNISQEGLRALHGSMLQGSIDLNKQNEEMEYMFSHQPVESFGNRLQRTLQESCADVSYEDRPSVEEQGNTVLNAFKGMADEIVSGYESGTRVRFVEDNTSDDGYRKLTQEDELTLLQDEFDEFVEKRFGTAYQEQNIRMTNATNDIQKTKQRLGIGDGKVYEAEKTPDNFVENLLNSGREYIANLLK